MMKKENIQKKISQKDLGKGFKKYLVIIIICLLIGFAAGFYYGMFITIEKVVDMAQRFLEINIRTDLINQAIYQYENNLGGCYPKLLINFTR